MGVIRLADKNTSLAKILRKNQTEAERHLWDRLRLKQLEGYNFRRQALIEKYIADFVCFEKRLVIEVDGGQHTDLEKDRVRDRWFEESGFKVLRFWNNEVLENIEGVLESIRGELLTPSPLSPPVKGGVENKRRKFNLTA